MVMGISQENRAIAAVIGAAVADAACQPVHWNYDQERLDKILANYELPEFITPSYNPFYCIETGEQSCYGDQAYVVLKSLVECRGVDQEHLKKATNEMFGDNSPYNDKVVDSYCDKSCFQESQAKYPVKGPWKHFSIKHFLKNFKNGMQSTGSDSDIQIDCVTKIAPVVALYAGRPEMLEKVEEVISVTQCHDIPIAFALLAARFLEKFILHGEIDDVAAKVICDLRDKDRMNPNPLDNSMVSHVKAVVNKKDMGHTEAVQSFGKS